VSGGAYGPTTDIGGYLDLLTPPTSLELLLRKQYAELHISAEPLILNLWKQAEATGIPIMRPLWLGYPGAAAAAAQDEEWLLGPDVLVAPVIDQGASSRSVYFPQGCWQDPRTGATQQGPSSATVSAPLDTLPYYVRCGTQPFKADAPASGPTCRRPTGRLRGKTLGPVTLGETRAQIRRAFPRVSLSPRRYVDVFCLASRRGIRIGYPSRALLRALPASERRRVKGRAVLALTSSGRYALGGVRPGARLAAFAHRLRLGRGFRIGANTWYLSSNGASRGVLKVRHGNLEEIGIADKQAHRHQSGARRFLKSFAVGGG
jgi:hypothetical protein